MANILLLEPFYGGSHKYFADGIIRHSKHSIRLLTLPGRFWKWRMEGAGLSFAQQIQRENIRKPDCILATNLMDLTQFKGLVSWQDVPHILYVHENQLDYPLSAGEKRDFHYVWKDYMNFLTADRLLFNSMYNLESFLSRFKSFSARLPDERPADPGNLFRSKTSIITPGCQLIRGNGESSLLSEELREAPLLLWNQRWEHDKNPEAFFSFLGRLKKREVPFRLAILGESYKNSPPCFSEAKIIFQEEILHMGFAESRSEYEKWLIQSDYVLSTALQENFGISVVEAMSAGTIPLLPNRLAYPEVLPPMFHNLCLYENEEDMIRKFSNLQQQTEEQKNRLKQEIKSAVSVYGWEMVAAGFDRFIDAL